jgi:ribose transport system ATP-binding protein
MPQASVSSTSLVARDLARRFGPVQALAGVSVELRPGRVHAFVGANGAGKSTLARILAGADRQDAGTMELGGANYAPSDPARARARGVAMVHQELSIAPHLSVAANIVLGDERPRGLLLRRGDEQRRAREALAKLGRADLPLDKLAGELPTAIQQLLELARALASDVRVLLLDEPTSSLERDDKLRLLALVEQLRERGLAIAWIGHHLDEVLRLADDLLVLRDGVVVARHQRGVGADELVQAMSGRALAADAAQVRVRDGAPLLALQGFRPRHFRAPLDLEVRAGEIVGLAGLVGAGRSRLLRSILGATPHDAGTARLAGVEIGLDPRSSVAQGAGFVSEDRKRDGLCLSIPIVDEVSLSAPGREARLGALRQGARLARVAGLVDEVRAKVVGLDECAATLSGGNQQKLALARLLHMDARLWLLDDPTRGIDVSAKRDIHALVRAKVADGRAALVASSDIPELLSWCDRIAVLARGRVVALRPAADWTEDEILAAATSAAGEAA